MNDSGSDSAKPDGSYKSEYGKVVEAFPQYGEAKNSTRIFLQTLITVFILEPVITLVFSYGIFKFFFFS
jgi:hypothetical protein